MRTISGAILGTISGTISGTFSGTIYGHYRKFLGQTPLMIFNIYIFSFFLGKKKRILAASHFLTHKAYLFSFVTALNFDNVPPCYNVQNYELNIFGTFLETFSGQHLNSFRDNFVGNFRDNFRTVLYELFRGQFLDRSEDNIRDNIRDIFRDNLWTITVNLWDKDTFNDHEYIYFF